MFAPNFGSAVHLLFLSIADSHVRLSSRGMRGLLLHLLRPRDRDRPGRPREGARPAAGPAAVQIGGREAVEADAVQVSLVLVLAGEVLHSDLEDVHLGGGETRNDVLAQSDLSGDQVVEDVDALLDGIKDILADGPRFFKSHRTNETLSK